jgi:hypothetical protein
MHATFQKRDALPPRGLEAPEGATGRNWPQLGAIPGRRGALPISVFFVFLTPFDWADRINRGRPEKEESSDKIHRNR